jgi:hypothetical protein
MQAQYGLTTSSVPGATEVASLKEAALLAMPDQLFTAALDAGRDIASAYAFELCRSEEARRDTHDGIAQLFIDNGVPYAFDETGRLAPTGSAAMIPLLVIQRQHADLAITSAYLREIDNTEIIHAVHERPAPMIPAGPTLPG